MYNRSFRKGAAFAMVMLMTLMAFMLTEGYRHTRSKSKYLLRLIIFALISQPFYFRMLFGRAPTNVLE